MREVYDVYPGKSEQFCLAEKRAYQGIASG